MPILHLTDMLDHAHRHAYAIGAFRISHFEMLRGVLQAAEDCRAPVILNFREEAFRSDPQLMLVSTALSAAQRASIPVALCLDHGHDMNAVHLAIRNGCNGVMIDTSTLALDDNLRLTRAAVQLAHRFGLAVEGEIGHIPWINDSNHEIVPDEISYTSPAEAKAFAERTGIDCLAVSIGTVHGMPKHPPKLDMTRLAKVSEAVGLPLVIHGGTGLSDDQYRKLIAHGVAKINYYSALAETGARAIREAVRQHGDADPAQWLEHSGQAIRDRVAHMIRLWGSGGRAAEVLQQCRAWREAELRICLRPTTPIPETETGALLRKGREWLAAHDGVRSVQSFISSAARTDARYCWIVRHASAGNAHEFADLQDMLVSMERALNISGLYCDWTGEVNPD